MPKSTLDDATPIIPKLTLSPIDATYAAQGLQLLLTGLLFWIAFAGIASAQSSPPLVTPNTAVVTGFSGIKPITAAPGGNPLDRFFIDTNGAALSILSLNDFGASPTGQLVATTAIRSIPAEKIGQVFAIAIGARPGSSVPDIYAGATSAYGIQIVSPTTNGGPDKRIKRGQADAQFMAGQFGTGINSGPGTIWLINGQTGDVAPFAVLPNNSGPGIGDIVFDPTRGQVFASDLDTGLIHRIGPDGTLIDAFDHGEVGRPAHNLQPVRDDALLMDITSSSFDVTDPTSWGYTPPERRIHAMALHDGRLYYAVNANKQVWSIGIAEDGSFAGDARWEFDAAALTGDGPITDMLFDRKGRLLLAQRGQAQGSYSYAAFTDSGNAGIARYAREPGNVSSGPGAWSAQADVLGVGLATGHQHANGGIALGFGYTSSGSIDNKQPGATLWATGGQLRSSLDNVNAADVYGIQGVSTDQLAAEIIPPEQSYFIDFDGLFADPGKVGHIGDIETWRVPTDSGQINTFVNLECPPGYDNVNGQCERATSVRPIVEPPRPIFRCPRGMVRVAARDVDRLRANGWDLAYMENGRWCGTPGTRPPRPERCPSNLEEVPPEDVDALTTAGWRLVQLDSGQWCGAPGIEPPPPPPPPIFQCPVNMSEVPFALVESLREAGWTIVRRRGRYCGRPGSRNPCRAGERMVLNAYQARILRQNGASVRSISWRGRRAWCAGPIPPRPTCNADERTVRRAIAARVLRQQGYQVRKIGRRHWCARKGVRVCRPHERTVGTFSDVVRLRAAGHRVRRIGLRKWCASRRPVRCKVGTIRKNGKCVPIIGKCPPGKIGVPPACVNKPKCKIGQIFRNGRCVAIIKKPRCKIGQVFRNGRCVAIIKKPRCKIGQVFRNGRCVAIIKKPRCKIGQVFRNGRCVAIIKKPRCKIGQVFRNGRCVAIIKKPRCKIGQVFRNGRCVAIIKKPRCKIGQVFRNGRCVAIIKKPRCKIGQVFRNGRCVAIIKKPRCRVGQVFRNGRCVAIIKKPRCRVGQVFRNGRCVAIIKKPRCRVGQVFRNGRCVAIIKKPRCRVGQVFRNGRCVAIIKKPRCRVGQVFRNGRCQPLVKKKKCPPGKVGNWPFCKKKK